MSQLGQDAMRCFAGTLTLSVIMLSGCQSGRVGYAQFGRDGSLVAFQDDRYRLVYVANEAGVRCIGSGEFALSYDGRYVLLLKPPLGDWSEPEYEKGNRVQLYDVQSRRRWHSKLPIGIPADAVFGGDVEPSDDEGREAGPVRVFFDEGPTVTIGPVDGAYWAWRPPASWKQAERPLTSPRPLPFPFRGRFGRRSRSLVQLGSDGWNARRTVWVQPDGSTLELLRQDDAPLWVGGLLLASPAAIVPPCCGLWVRCLLGTMLEFTQLPEDETEETLRQVVREHLQSRLMDDAP